MINENLIRDKFYEILSSKDIEEQQNMGFNNIDQIKRYEFLEKVLSKNSKIRLKIPTNISNVYNMAYCNVDTIARSPDTAIVKAVYQGDYDLVDSMLTALNIDPNTKVSTLKHEASSLLRFACINNKKEIARLLLEKGASIILDYNNGITVLHTAITAGHFDMVEFLLENGADPNYVKDDNFSYLTRVSY
ncbi:ankyrin repeat domain-containing protein [Rickettsia endosymbiont of Ixodes scapularis]|uniref:ankyrin repeat domain-containing protein n=1 Tax=Rickettsia endosymbiont of Ixodes scapularis TaxID=444612 RepID=UPI0001A60904|nr:ankyrin repeat domain-containing protein [Rickettsia endosymbiont of Ixodes scapularis]EER22766.1 putative ankyrin repeat protein [Rickettsia endosymbiont of Ixodes scapularis]